MPQNDKVSATFDTAMTKIDLIGQDPIGLANDADQELNCIEQYQGYDG